MPDAKLLEAVGGLSATALFVAALWLVYTRRVRTAGEVIEDAAAAEARLDEMRQDRDAWRALAEAYGTKLDTLVRTLEIVVAFGAKLDAILDLLGKGSRATDRIRELVERVIAKVSG